MSSHTRRIPPFPRHSNERGQTVLEYGMIISSVAVVLMASLVVLQGDLDAWYQAISDFLETVL